MNKKVYVLGELNVDMILTGENIQPEPNKEKMVDDFEFTLGSSSAITACRLAQLGLDVYFVSVIGSDQFGHFCLQRLRDFNVNTDYVTLDENAKTGVTVSLSTPADRSLLTYMGTINQLAPEHIPESLWQEADHLHFGSFYLQEAMKVHWLDLLQKAKKSGISTSFDTGWDPHERWDREIIEPLLAFTDLFMPSETEIQHIYGIDSVDHIEKRFPKTHGQIFIKQGSNGASLISPDRQRYHHDGFRVKVIDTTGAGDSFNAGAIYAYLSGMNEHEQLRFANACGALSVQHVGGTGGVIHAKAIEEVEHVK